MNKIHRTEGLLHVCTCCWCKYSLHFTLSFVIMSQV